MNKYFWLFFCFGFKFEIFIIFFLSKWQKYFAYFFLIIDYSTKISFHKFLKLFFSKYGNLSNSWFLCIEIHTVQLQTLKTAGVEWGKKKKKKELHLMTILLINEQQHFSRKNISNFQISQFFCWEKRGERLAKFSLFFYDYNSYKVHG